MIYRRQLLAGVCLGLSGVVAGCTSRAADEFDSLSAHEPLLQIAGQNKEVTAISYGQIKEVFKIKKKPDADMYYLPTHLTQEGIESFSIAIDELELRDAPKKFSFLVLKDGDVVHSRPVTQSFKYFNQEDFHQFIFGFKSKETAKEVRDRILEV